MMEIGFCLRQQQGVYSELCRVCPLGNNFQLSKVSQVIHFFSISIRDTGNGINGFTSVIFDPAFTLAIENAVWQTCSAYVPKILLQKTIAGMWQGEPRRLPDPKYAGKTCMGLTR